MRKMLKKGIALLIAFLLLLCGVRMTEAAALEEWPAAAQSIPDTLGVETGAKAALVMDAASGRVLFAKNSSRRRSTSGSPSTPPPSTWRARRWGCARGTG